MLFNKLVLMGLWKLQTVMLEATKMQYLTLSSKLKAKRKWLSQANASSSLKRTVSQQPVESESTNKSTNKHSPPVHVSLIVILVHHTIYFNR